MKLCFWRTYCKKCGLWLRGDWWFSLGVVIEYWCACPLCGTKHRKWTRLEPEGYSNVFIEIK